MISKLLFYEFCFTITLFRPQVMLVNPTFEYIFKYSNIRMKLWVNELYSRYILIHENCSFIDNSTARSAAAESCCCSVTVEQPATFVLEKVLTPPSLASPGMTRSFREVEAARAENKMDQGRLKMASVTSLAAVFEEEEACQEIAELLLSSREELITETCQYDAHNFRADADIFPPASFCCM